MIKKEESKLTYERIQTREKFTAKIKKHFGLWAIIMISLTVLIQYFDYFPNGWDQTVYAMSVKSDFLPHSPYIFYFFMGKLFSQFLDPAAALSLLSLLSGILFLCLFYFLNLKFFASMAESPEIPGYVSRLFSFFCTALLGFSFLFIDQASTQEVYVFLSLLIFLSIYILYSSRKFSVWAGGIVFGCAVAAHNGALFILPALIYALLVNKKERPVRSILLFLSCAAAVWIFFAFIIYLQFPVDSGGNRFHSFLGYIRGISPGVHFDSLVQPHFLDNSLKGIFSRLTSLDIEINHFPPQCAPLGAGWLHLVLGFLGLAAALRYKKSPVLFWLLYLAPYFGYEFVLGENVDYGVYILFLFPPLLFFVGAALILPVFDWEKVFKGPSRAVTPPGGEEKGINIKTGGKRKIAIALQFLILLLLLYPSVRLVGKYWSRDREDALKHYSETTLAAMWIARNLPENAVIVKPVREQNAHIIPYYSERRQVVKLGRKFWLQKDKKKYRPINITSFELLTTGKLKEMIAAGVPVYAFTAHPFWKTRHNILDRRFFFWEKEVEIDLKPIREGINVPGEMKKRLPAGKVCLFRGKIR